MSIRVNKGLSLKNRLTYEFQNFRGVDFSTSPYKVLPNRATDAQNLLYKNGTVRKRNGWKSLCNLNAEINGVFNFSISDNDIILVYAGTNFFLLNWNETTHSYDATNITQSSSVTDCRVNQDDLISRRVQVFINDNKAYIIGAGDYLVFGKYGDKYELRKVFNEPNTYIPTTTINIYNNSVTDNIRESFDKVNLLTDWRYNKLLGCDEVDKTWRLDSPIDNNSTVEITVNTLNEDGEMIETILSNRIGSDSCLLYGKTDDLESKGSVNFEKGEITLNIKTTPLEPRTSNIIVKFKCSLSLSNKITKTTFGVLFGGDGNSNRLFLSGNIEYRNAYFWSSLYDYTYFADTEFDLLGTNNSSILGFVRATDGVLLAFKEQTGVESLIYYIKATDVEENSMLAIQIKSYAGEINDTIVSHYTNNSLNGDILLLTKNGVKGLELYENITTNAYRMRDRSRNINIRLLKHKDLTKASSIVYKDKYFLSIEGVVYLCDSGFTFQSEEDVSNNYGYEWWFLTNIDARVWFINNGELFFGTNNGLICKFIDDEFADVITQHIDSGNITIDYTENNIVCNSNLLSDLNKSSSICFTSGDVYGAYLDSDSFDSVDENGWIYFNEDLLYKIYDGIECYVDKVGTSGLIAGEKYVIQDVDLDNVRFRLYRNESFVIPCCVGFSLNKNLSGKELYVDDVVGSAFRVKEFKDSEILDLVIYNNTIPTELKAKLQFRDSVVAEWYTPICDFGTNMYSKTLLGFSVLTEPLVGGRIEVGYQTRNIGQNFATYGSKGFDFNDIDFENFAFESSFATSNTVRCKERNFNFIIFKYVSDSDSPCAVNAITIRYKVNRINKGVR